jgi:CRISPR-associated protein Csb2
MADRDRAAVGAQLVAAFGRCEGACRSSLPAQMEHERPIGKATLGGPQGFRWRLVGDPQPPLGSALPLGQAVRAAVYRAAARRGMTRLPDGFHGIGDDPSHGHAFWLPEDADGDGLLDHVLLFADRGLPPALVPALAEPGEVWLGPLGRWTLQPDWMGRRAAGGLFGPARRWQAASAYVTPRWQTRKPGAVVREGRTPDEQLLQDVVSRGLPPPAVAWTSGIPSARGLVGPRGFTLGAGKRRPPGDWSLGFPELHFDRPVWGPLAFGFGAHFGLGLLAPADGT